MITSQLSPASAVLKPASVSTLNTSLSYPPRFNSLTRNTKSSSESSTNKMRSVRFIRHPPYAPRAMPHLPSQQNNQSPPRRPPPQSDERQIPRPHRKQSRWTIPHRLLGIACLARQRPALTALVYAHSCVSSLCNRGNNLNTNGIKES